MISTVFKTTALADEVELLFVASLRGEIRTDGKGSAPMHIGSKQTPISRGLSEGYSKEDIAYFYIARELGNNWSEKILENLSEEFRSKINTAFNAFREDVNIEKSSVRKQPLDIPFYLQSTISLFITTLPQPSPVEACFTNHIIWCRLWSSEL